MIMASGSAMATTETISSFTAISGSIGTNVSYESFIGGGTVVPIVNSSQIRLYQNASGTGRGFITVSVPIGYTIAEASIQSAMATTVAYSIDGSENPKTGSAALTTTGTYTVGSLNATSVTFHCMGTTATSRLYVKNLSVTYSNAASPTLTVTPTTLNSFIYNYGSGTSAEQSFTVSGTNLTADVSIAPSANYEISTGSGGLFVAASGALPITMSNANAGPTTIYTRLKAGLAVGTYNESINISSTDAITKTVACNGSVACVPSSLAFATATLNRTVGDVAFSQLATSSSSGAISYSSTAPTIATVNANTGQVTIVSAGVTTITATQVANAEYCGNSATYTLNIASTDPTITILEISVPEMITIVGSTSTESINVGGVNLTTNISLALTGANANQFSLSTTSIAQSGGTAPNTAVTITYAPTTQAAHTATLTISSGTATAATFTLNGQATYAPLATPTAIAATGISANGFTANWEAVPGATSYELDVYTKTMDNAKSTELFISEYTEGSGNNKLIEIYNGTGISVNLSNYSLKKQVNGVDPYSSEQVLAGTLAHNDVYVLANTNASAAILALSDDNNGTTTTFNGNDAVALFKNSVKIDEVGVFNQTTDWGKDLTLIRKSSIMSPQATYNAAEWDTQSTDYIADLGMHTLSIQYTNYNSISGYPIIGITDIFKPITGLNASTSYFYTVVAKNSTVTSSTSNEIAAATSNTTALENTTSALRISTSNGKIMLNATAGESVNIYNAVGQLLISKVAVEGVNTIAISAKSVVIVKVGNKVAKVIL